MMTGSDWRAKAMQGFGCKSQCGLKLHGLVIAPQPGRIARRRLPDSGLSRQRITSHRRRHLHWERRQKAMRLFDLESRPTMRRGSPDPQRQRNPGPRRPTRSAHPGAVRRCDEAVPTRHRQRNPDRRRPSHYALWAPTDETMRHSRTRHRQRNQASNAQTTLQIRMPKTNRV